LVCPKNKVKRRNQCVKRHVHHRKHRRARRAHAKTGGRHG
jgi:hypothetical protein